MTYKVSNINRADTVMDAIKYLRNDSYDEKLSLEDNKHRVDEFDRRTYILDTYVILLCNKVEKMISKQVPVSVIIEGLKIQDWDNYSVSGNAFYGKNLNKVLFRKTSESRILLLSIQANYLEQASNHIIEVLEDFVC